MSQVREHETDLCRVNKLRLLIRMIAFAMIVIPLMTFIACKAAHNTLEGYEKVEPINTEATSSVTKMPASNEPAMTSAPTNAPSPTPEPTQKTGSNWKVEEFNSIKSEYIVLMEEYLAGGKPDFAPLKNPLNKPEYWFDNSGKFEGGWLGTFSSYLYLSNEADDEWDHYLCLHHVSSLPLETYRAAVDKIIEYRKQFWSMDSVRTDGEEENFGFAPIACFCGDDWFVLPDWEVEMNRQVHSIWRTDDGEHYYEFGAKNGELGVLTDALIVSDKIAYLCCTSWDYEDGRGFRVFFTCDGGESWKALELEVPEEYSGYGSSFAFAPVFDGDKGVFAVRLCMDEGLFEVILFETDDGGATWSCCHKEAQT